VASELLHNFLLNLFDTSVLNAVKCLWNKGIFWTDRHKCPYLRGVLISGCKQLWATVGGSGLGLGWLAWGGRQWILLIILHGHCNSISSSYMNLLLNFNWMLSYWQKNFLIQLLICTIFYCHCYYFFNLQCKVWFCESAERKVGAGSSL
jgi:hypothetical protein